MRRAALAALAPLLLAAALACTGDPTPQPPPSPTATATPVPMATATPTPTPTATATPAPEATATATSAAAPAPAAPVVCEAGAAPDPDSSPTLVADCATLLGLRDTLRGGAPLDWSAEKPIAQWEGVTVSGTPPRVTKLELTNGGLTGELSGLLGELTGLTELRLDGNALTGRIPSKVAQLTRLTHAFLAGNPLSGCVPPSLRAVANHDLARVGLADCAEPIDISFEDGPLTAGAYQFRWDEESAPLIFDIPAGLTLRVDGVVIAELGEDGSYAPPGLILQQYQGDSWICLDLDDGWECNRWTPSPAVVSGSSGADIDSLFDRLAESAWVKR